MNIRRDASRAWAFLTRRTSAYRGVFAGPVAKIVLDDLRKFCRGDQTCFNEDPRIHAVLEGRREVWLRIRDHLDLPDEHLWEKFNPNRPLIGDDDQ